MVYAKLPPPNEDPILKLLPLKESVEIPDVIIPHQLIRDIFDSCVFISFLILIQMYR